MIYSSRAEFRLVSWMATQCYGMKMRRFYHHVIHHSVKFIRSFRARLVSYQAEKKVQTFAEVAETFV